MDEVDLSIEDKLERDRVLEGQIGFILTSTQVFESVQKPVGAHGSIFKLVMTLMSDKSTQSKLVLLVG